MAEVIGIVASGIAIGQATTAITSSLLKLKSLWNEFRDVPEDLLHLVYELEVVYLVLAESDPQCTSSTCSASSRSLELAWQLTNDGAKELKSLVDDLQTELKQNRRWKGKFVAAKIVLKRDQIKRLKSRLKTCIRLLTLANQSKISSMLERQPELLAMELTAMTRNMDHAGQEEEMDQDNTPQISKPCMTPQHSKIIQIQSAFQLRLRLLYREWYFYCHRSHAGWDLVLRVFTVVPHDNPILYCIVSDNDKLLRENFRTGKASPLMLVDSGGRSTPITLLAYATYWGNVKTTQLLLDEGADVLEHSIETYSNAIWQLTTNTANLIHFRSLKGPENQQADEQRLLSVGEILLRDSKSIATRENYFDEYRSYRTYLWCFRGTLAFFQLVQTTLCPNYYLIPFKGRVDLASSMAKQYCNSPDVVWAALGFDDSSQANFEAVAHLIQARNLLKLVAKRFGHSVFETAYKPSRREIHGPLYHSTTDFLAVTATDMFDEEHYPLCGWKAFLGQLIRAGADPNLETSHGTPLISIVVGAFTIGFDENPFGLQYPSLENSLRKPDKGKISLLAWLETLKNFGVNLEAYGRKEASILSREDAKWPGREILLYRRTEFAPGIGLYLRLIAFEYGPNPEDWKFWFSDPTDQLVGEFWDMLEHPERSMPGAWDEFSW